MEMYTYFLKCFLIFFIKIFEKLNKSYTVLANSMSINIENRIVFVDFQATIQFGLANLWVDLCLRAPPPIGSIHFLIFGIGLNF